MNVEELKRNLNYTRKKHRDDRLFTGQTNISLMCEDTLNTISDLEAEIAKLQNENDALRQRLVELERSLQL